MQQRPDQRHLTVSEIISVFKALGLETEEKRERICRLADIGIFNNLSNNHIVTWLSNSSEPMFVKEDEDRKYSNSFSDPGIQVY